MGYTSTIANQVLVTPFDDKSVVTGDISEKLTEEEFCEHCYSKPKFQWESQQYMSEDAEGDDNDSPTYYNDIKNQIHQQKISYNNFDLWLSNYTIDKVYTISGNAGTGKTTFINQRRYEESNIEWIILDIHLARSNDEWMTDIRTDISHFESAQAKVYGTIMNKLWELIFKGTDSNNNYSLDIVYENLLTLIQNYEKRFRFKYPSGRKMMDEIIKIMDKGVDVLQKVEGTAEIFKKYINGQIGEEGKEINDILNFFLLALRCMSEDEEKKYCIVFDNFERFVAKDEIYNKDVDKIRLLLTSYIKRINQAGNINKGYFKFIMAVRDSTARMCGVRLHASDSEASNLDLSKWYDTQDIINLKKKWYANNNITIKNIDIVEQIISDCKICTDQSITGLQQLVNPLFNDNKRLIIDFIGTMVEMPGNEKYITMYQSLWDENTQQSRFAARSIIRGLILKELEDKQDNLFLHLKTYSINQNENGIGDARKILTILYNNVKRGNENEMSMSSVLSELFNSSDIEELWNDKTRANERSTVSKILFHMNSYNRRENDWVQFIDIQFKDSKADIIVKTSSKLERILSSQMNNCSVHILGAGKVYLTDIVASFEFFSMRYVPNYAPLFTLIPTTKDIERCVVLKELPCYKKIKAVSKYAIECIKRLQSGEDSIKIYIGNQNNGKYHYERIINKHKSYIDRFVQYIKEKYCSDRYENKFVKNKYAILCNEITILRNHYNKYEEFSYRE